MINPGIYEQQGDGGTPPVSLDRYATAADAALYANVNEGDYIIEELDGNGVSSYEGAGRNNLITLGPGQKLHIKGQQYEYIRLELNNVVGTQGNPVIITNLDGQVEANYMLISGAQHARITGKFESGISGDSNFNGELGLPNQHGLFGFKLSTEWRPTYEGVANLYITGVAYNASPRANNIEVDHIECTGGNFAGMMVKEDYYPDPFFDATVDQIINIHDNFVHDVNSEGLYLGNTSATDPQHRVAGVVRNNVIVRTGSEAIQWGHQGPDCIEENNITWSAVAWKDPFQVFQDGCLQKGIRKAGNVSRHNLHIHSANRFLFYTNITNTDVPADGDQTGLKDEIYNSYFGPCRTEKLYIANNPPLRGHSLDIYDNDFAEDIFTYDEAYPEVTEANYILTVVGSGIPTTIRDNNFADTKAIAFPGANLTLSNNQQGVSIPLPQFEDWGFGSMFAEQFEQFSQYIREADQGQTVANSYKTNDRVEYLGKFYRVLQDTTGTPPLPAGVTDANYELLFSGGFPADGYRLIDGDYHNLLGRGLDNNFPNTRVPWNSKQLNADSGLSWKVLTPTTGGTLPFAAIDRGNNEIEFKYGVNEFKYNSCCPVVVGLGSSTMEGSDATAGNSIADLLQNHVEATLNGKWHRLSNIGYYSNRFLPDEDLDPENDTNLNIDAALAFNPDIIILSLPSNDQAEGLNSNTDFMANLVRIDQRCKERGVVLFVTQTQPRRNYSAAEQTRLAEAAALILAEFGPRCVPIFDELTDSTAGTDAYTKDAYASPDLIHLNNSGHLYVYNQIVATMNSYFVDPNYNKFVIERSTSPTSGFTVYQDNVSPANNSLVVTRENETLYYYRCRAQLQDLSFTEYSDVRSLSQIFRGLELTSSEVKLNFTTGNYPSPAGWNDILPANSNNLVAGETFVLNDVNGVPSGLTLEVLDDFFSIGENGPRLEDGATEPTNISRSVHTFTNGLEDQERLRITGFDPLFRYEFEFFGSTNSDNEDRYTGYTAKDKGGSLQPRPSGQTYNLTDTVKFEIETDGSCIVYLKPMEEPGGAGGIGRINWMKIKKYSNRDVFPWSTGVAQAASGSTWAMADEPLTPSSFTSNHEYRTGQFMWVYIPPGYDNIQNQSKNYDLVMHLHGSGKRGSNINVLLNNGLPKYLNGSYEPADVIIIAPQLPSGAQSWNDYYINDALTYMRTNYRINDNCISMTGFSLGGAALALYLSYASNYGSQIVAGQSIGGAQFFGNTTVRNNVINNNVAIFAAHGTNDNTQDESNPKGWLDNINPYNPKFPVEVSYHYPLGHSGGSVADDKFYNPATQIIDIVRWLTSFSKDNVELAEKKVAYMEYTQKWADYSYAKLRVDELSAGPNKTSLQNRLTTFLQGKNVTRTIINPGSVAAAGNINNISGLSSGSSITNLVNEAGQNTGFSFSIVTEFAASTRVRDATTSLEAPYHGFPKECWRYGASVDPSRPAGEFELSGLDDNLNYNIVLLPTAGIFNFTVDQSLEFRCNGQTVRGYFHYSTGIGATSTGNSGAQKNGELRINGLTPVGGIIRGECEAIADGLVQIALIILEEQSSLTGPVFWTAKEVQAQSGTTWVESNAPPPPFAWNSQALNADQSGWLLTAPPAAETVVVNFGVEGADSAYASDALPGQPLPEGYVSVGWGEPPTTNGNDTTTREMLYLDNENNSINDLLGGDGSRWKIRVINNNFRQTFGYFNGAGGELGYEGGSGYAFDVNAVKDAWFVGNLSTNYTGTFEIYNLDPNEDYLIEILGSYEAAGTVNTDFSVGGQTAQRINVAQNVSNLATFTQNAGGSGVISVAVSNVAGSSPYFGYINAMRITKL